MLSSDLLRFFLIIAGLLHLQLGDWLPPYVRYGGDLLLVILFIILVSSKNGAGIEIKRTGQIIGVTFFTLNVLYVIYSFLFWGELLLVVRLARQSLLFSMYLYIVSKLYGISPKRMQKYRVELIFLVFLALNTLLAGLKIYLPTYSEEAVLFQGLPVRKIFVRGSVGLYLLPLFWGRADKRTYSYQVWVAVTIFYFLIVARYILPFRSWFVVFAVVLTIYALMYAFYYGKKLSNKDALYFIVLIILLVLSILYLKDQPSSIKEWLSSLIIDVRTGGGTFEYRLVRDWSRVTVQFEDHWIYILLGYGFVHPESSAAAHLGFSTETNDTGIVQFLLTYGLVGTLFFFVLWFRWIYICIKNFLATGIDGYLRIAFVLIIMVGMLLSSNFFAWETFFVPILLTIGILQVRITQTLKKCNFSLIKNMEEKNENSTYGRYKIGNTPTGW